MFGHAKEDSVAGFVVFLVAVPLCLGIAIACGVPPVSGLIAGIVGGLVVPWISRSPLSVTGPAAGLTSIVLVEVQRLGGVNPFLTAVIIAGALQLVLGLVRAGRFAALVPSSVIKGMLAAIGVIIMAWPEATKNVLGIVIGIGLTLLGLLFLFSGYQLSKVKATLTSGS